MIKYIIVGIYRISPCESPFIFRRIHLTLASMNEVRCVAQEIRPFRLASVLGRARLAGLAALALCLGLLAWGPVFLQNARDSFHDHLLSLFPVEAPDKRVTVVEIDERSLYALGQWPWPRSLTAQVVAAIQNMSPIVIGLSMVMPEPDRSSPDILAARTDLPPEIRLQLSLLPGHDRLLARAMASGPAPVVMGVAGNGAIPQPVLNGSGGSLPPVLLRGEGSALHATHYPGLLRSRTELERAAAGFGLISVEKDSYGKVRRLPLVAWAQGQPFPALVTEMLRLAVNAMALELWVTPTDVAALAVGGHAFPVAADGTVRVGFPRSQPIQRVSAVDVLEGRGDASLIRDHFVLIGVTGLGLTDEVSVAEGTIPSVHAHAHLLQSLLTNSLPLRPDWMPLAELALTFVLGILVIVRLPRAGAPWLGLLGAMVVSPIPLAVFALVQQGMLLDGLSPALAGGIVFMAMTLVQSADDRRQRMLLRRALDEHHLRMAHLGGELASERRAAEDRLQFIDMISHEYRTPLAVLRAGLDVLELRLRDSSQVRTMGRMRRAVIRLSEIVDVGLARARLDGSQIPVQRERIDLTQCLEEAAASARAVHAGRQIIIDVVGAAPSVPADPPMLKTAFLNLLDNALKYSDADVFVGVECTSGEPPACRVSIADEGIGMGAEDAARVFERFYRSPDALSKPGTGMGLGITRRIIELHDGKIELSSEPGKGTTVIVTLPLAPAVNTCVDLAEG